MKYPEKSAVAKHCVSRRHEIDKTAKGGPKLAKSKCLGIVLH
jgi:hypothetical protein